MTHLVEDKQSKLLKNKTANVYRTRDSVNEQKALFNW